MIQVRVAIESRSSQNAPMHGPACNREPKESALFHSQTLLVEADDARQQRMYSPTHRSSPLPAQNNSRANSASRLLWKAQSCSDTVWSVVCGKRALPPVRVKYGARAQVSTCRISPEWVTGRPHRPLGCAPTRTTAATTHVLITL